MNKKSEHFYLKREACEKIDTLPKKQVAQTVLVYYAICRIVSEKEKFVCCKSEIAKYAGVSEKTVQRYLKNLEKLGIVKIPLDLKSNGVFEKREIWLNDNTFPVRQVENKVLTIPLDLKSNGGTPKDDFWLNNNIFTAGLEVQRLENVEEKEKKEKEEKEKEKEKERTKEKEKEKEKKEKEKKEKEAHEKEKKIFIPPTKEDVILFFQQKGFSKALACRAFDYYSAGNWKDSRGNPVKNWKQKMIAVWLREENRERIKNSFAIIKNQ